MQYVQSQSLVLQMTFFFPLSVISNHFISISTTHRISINPHHPHRPPTKPSDDLINLDVFSSSTPPPSTTTATSSHTTPPSSNAIPTSSVASLTSSNAAVTSSLALAAQLETSVDPVDLVANANNNDVINEPTSLANGVKTGRQW